MIYGNNIQIIIGYIKKEPKLTKTNSGKDVFTFETFVKDLAKKELGPDGYPVGEWFKVVVWGNYGVSLSNFMKKGDKVYVVGSNKSSKTSDGKTYWHLLASYVMQLSSDKRNVAPEPVLSTDEAPDPVDDYDPFAE